ncbi:MAG: cbb3-type cytochrome c oxidase N-terminal domain-containing protein [Luteolibacter sp.]
MSEEQEIRRAQYAEKKGEVVLREHEYDGIQEYDQKLPNWWLVIFLAGNLFFFAYWFAYYQMGWFPSDEEKISAAMSHIADAKENALEGMLARLDDKALINDWATDTQRVTSGREVYMGNCIACHGENMTASIDIGGGQTVPLPGLSLKDGEWKYGSKPMDLFKLINEGTPADSTGHNGAKMEAWGQRMPLEEIAEVTAFIISENPEDFVE